MNSFRNRNRHPRAAWQRFRILTSLSLLLTVSGLGWGVSMLVQRARAAAQPPGQLQTASTFWQPLESNAGVAGKRQARRNAPQARALRMNELAVSQVLLSAPFESDSRLEDSSAILPLPMPDGTYVRFRLQESPLLGSALAKQFPTIKSYRGESLESDGLAGTRLTMRAAWSPAGLSATILSNSEVITVSTDSQSNGVYLSQTAGPVEAGEFSCGVTDSGEVGSITDAGGHAGPRVSIGGQLRTYRLALAATWEYCDAFGGGTNAGTVASLNVWVNGVNVVYERELAIRLVLVNNLNSLYTTERGFNADNDPFTNTDQNNMLNQVRPILSEQVGLANFDLGHVLGARTGFAATGVSGIGVVCANTLNDPLGPAKAAAATRFGTNVGVGEINALGVFIHELGHQFGAHHSFNGTLGGCQGAQRSGNTGWEPGSGNTIMSYIALCETDNIGFFRDLRFHNGSFREIANYLAANGSCGALSSTGNNPPLVSAGPDFTIPKQTPFKLTATGSDPDAADSGKVTYVWEQLDAGAANYANPPYGDQGSDPFNTTRPLFRPYFPTFDNTRTLPSLQYILNNANVPPATMPTGLAAPNDVFQTAESLPRIVRTLNFRVTARDQRGGVNEDAMVITVHNTGPFNLTAPNSAVTWTGGSTQTVTWNVNGTNALAANVRILLSTDGGASFPTVLSASTPNDGNQAITVPNATFTTQARLKLEAVDNIFFDISDLNFSITPANGCAVVTAFTPAGLVGQNIVLTGTNFTGVTALRFSNNVSATFTVNSNTQITATVPAGAATGPLTLVKPGCPDATTSAFTVCTGAAANLIIDDAQPDFTLSNGLPGQPVYYINRLTPTTYPATLRNVVLVFLSQNNIPEGTPITILAGANADGNTDINNTNFQTVDTTVGPLNQFNGYDVPAITINSGDFVVGYRITFANGQSPTIIDIDAPAGRSYVSLDGGNFSVLSVNTGTIINPNLLIRAQYFTGCAVTPTPTPTSTPTPTPTPSPTPTPIVCSFAINPTGQSVAPTGGNGTIAVTASAGSCGWTASSNAAWLTITSGAAGTGNGNVAYTAAANNGSARTGTLTVAGQTFTVNQTSGCTFTLNPTSQNIVATGGNGDVAVTASDSNCSWTATSNAAWLTITAGAAGTGNGTVSFSATANTGLARTGTLTVAGQTFTVNQASGCAFTIAPTSQTVAAAGGNGTIAVTATNGNCPWTATSNAAWLTINTGATGTGNGNVTFTVAANTGPARTGTLTLAGLTFTVNQALGCTYSIAPTSQNFIAAGGNGTVNVTSVAGCPWTATSNAAFITVNTGATGTGSSTVTFTVAANSGIARTGTLTVAGQTFTVNQAANCTFTINPSNQNFPAAGGTGTTAVTAQTDCAWTATSNAEWLAITAGTMGTGNGTASFSVAANTGAARTGALTIAGQTFTVTQAAVSALAQVSAASYLTGDFTVDSIVAAFGTTLAGAVQAPQITPLPTSLGGTTVTIKDSAGLERLAPLFFISPGQVNYLVPIGTALGTALVTIQNANGGLALGTINIAPVAPALFTANANGRDVPAGVLVRVRNGVQTFEPIAVFDANTQRFSALPLDLGPSTDTVVLVLFGTGFRNRTALDNVEVAIGNPGQNPPAVLAPVSFAGPAPGLIGVDQLNVALPRGLVGRGLVELNLKVDGKSANMVKVSFK